MIRRLVERVRSGGAPGVAASGVFLIVVSVLGFALGWMLTNSLVEDFRTSIDASGSALAGIGETIAVVEDVADGTTTVLEDASRSASSAADTAQGAAASIEDTADFLDTELPDNIESVLDALPGAIAAADTVDTTLNALSFVGLDYSPDKPLGDSLREVQTALRPLPAEVRLQSANLRQLVTAAEGLADDADSLAGSLGGLTEGLSATGDLTDSYSEAIVDADAVIDQTRASVDRTVALIRLILALVALAGAVTGFALISIDRAIGPLVSPKGDPGSYSQSPAWVKPEHTGDDRH